MYMPPDNSQEFTPPPAGTHIAVCYRVIDLGTQQISFNGETKRQRKILISWELPDEKMDDGKPFTVHKRYTLSSNEKATLRLHLEAWRGKAFEDSDFGPGGFDIKNILGKACALGIVHNQKNGQTYANIASVGKAPKSIEVKPAVNEPIYLTLEKGAFMAEVFAKLPEKLRNTIAGSPEYIEAVKPKGNDASNGTGGAHFDDDIPF